MQSLGRLFAENRPGLLEFSPYLGMSAPQRDWPSALPHTFRQDTSVQLENSAAGSRVSLPPTSTWGRPVVRHPQQLRLHQVLVDLNLVTVIKSSTKQRDQAAWWIPRVYYDRDLLMEGWKRPIGVTNTSDDRISTSSLPDAQPLSCQTVANRHTVTCG